MKRTLNFLSMVAVVAAISNVCLAAEDPIPAEPGAGPAAEGAGDTNATAGDTNITARTFEVLQRKNIFNPNRRPIRPRDNTPRVQVDYFKLNGTMTYEDKAYAFFDGTGGQFRNKTLGRSEKIGEYTITEISNNAVKLMASSNQTVNLRIGMQMRRENNGPWKLIAGPDSVPDTSSSDSSSDSSAGDGSSGAGSSGGAVDDVVKRLMERREKESKDPSIGNDKQNEND